ncbi:MAG: hypothetical protein ABSG36_08925 [Acidimicrobiales bacterium]|jgi:hypothetical protein
MRPRLLLVILTVAIAFAAGCGGSTAGSGGTSKGSAALNGIATKTGKQIVAAALAATKTQSSFHFVEVASTTASSVSIVGDVGSSSGEQRITVSESGESGHITLLLADKTAYFSGDTFGLEGFTGMSKADATPLAGKWIAVPSSNSTFSALSASLAVKTAAAQLVSLTGTLTRGKASTELGHKAIAVKAAEKNKSGSLALTMYVATTGAALPIRVEGTTQATGSAARSITATFSNWGEKLNLSAPASSEPIADVKALKG